MTGYIEHFFMRLVAIVINFFMKYLFKSFALFLLYGFYFVMDL